MSDRFWRQQARHEARNQAERERRVADSTEVRIALIARMNAGELTLDQVQAELAKLKRGAKKNGKITRNQAFRGY